MRCALARTPVPTILLLFGNSEHFTCDANEQLSFHTGHTATSHPVHSCVPGSSSSGPAARCLLSLGHCLHRDVRHARHQIEHPLPFTFRVTGTPSGLQLEDTRVSPYPAHWTWKAAGQASQHSSWPGLAQPPHCSSFLCRQSSGQLNRLHGHVARLRHRRTQAAGDIPRDSDCTELWQAASQGVTRLPGRRMMTRLPAPSCGLTAPPLGGRA